MKALAKPSENDAGRAMGAVVPMRALIAPAAPAKPAGRKRRRSRIAVALEQTQPSHVDLKAIDGSEGWQSRIMDALGTTSPDFVDAEIGRLLKAFQGSDGTVSQSLFNAALAVVDGIRPRNEMEAMVGIQMAITHALSMKFGAAVLKSEGEHPIMQDSNTLALSRLQRAFTSQVDALANLRRGGRQKVRVDHVHVYPGAQAIVGNVTHRGRGVSSGNSGQAHASDDKRAIASEASASMRCADSARDALSVPGCEGQAPLSNARGSARLGSTKGQAERKLSSRLLHRGGNGRASRTPSAH